MLKVIDLDTEINTLKEGRFERQERIKWWDQNILKKANILVVGAGTLGNEVCKNLALLGLGNITIIDYDKVEEVNLSRSVLMRTVDIGKNKAEIAAERMNELYDEINVAALNLDIIYEYGSGNYKNFDLVIMTVDNLEARITINKYCYMWKKPLIEGGLDGLLCNVQVIKPPETACYECTLGESDYARMRERYSCSGLRKNLHERKIPMIITSAAIGGGLITQEAVKLLHNVAPVLAGKRAYIDGNTNKFDIVSVPQMDNCPSHCIIEQEKLLNLAYSNETTLKELKELIKRSIDGDFQIMHDKSILYGGYCLSCGYEMKWIGPLGLITEDILICKYCKGSMKLDIEETGLLKCDNYTLDDYKIPKNHVLRVCTENGNYWYLSQRN